ncbi:MAG: hypothetical protein K2M46_02980 [Lachnospiraceae bacterium]|nr:hypothetical protein [Lachnospiraceae bacterium]
METQEMYLNCLCNENMEKAYLERELKMVDGEKKAILRFKLRDLEFTKETDNFFDTLIEIRKELEPRNIKLLCKGCCKNIAPSRMSIEMGAGVIAYIMELGKQATEKVSIFDECTINEYANVDEQLEFVEQWYESLKR